MALSSTTYVGDGVTSIFNVSFPYISKAHVSVEHNARVLASTEWKWVTDSSIQIINTNGSANPPGDQDSIVIQRSTSPSARLVDFQNGAVLTEDDLDTSATQMFYLTQENAENLTALINDALTRIAADEGIIGVGENAVINEVVAAVLADETAAEIQQRITDIDTNAASIVEDVFNLGLLGAPNAGLDAFVMDTSTVKIDSDGGDTFATRLTALGSADGVNAAAIITEQTARVSADGVLAADIALIGARNGAADAFIIDTSTIELDSDGGTLLSTKISSFESNDTDQLARIVVAEGISARTNPSQLNTDLTAAEGTIVSLEAHYGVTLNVNDYITGFTLLNDGQTGTFDILTDKFRVVDPANNGQNPKLVFAIQDGEVYLQNLNVGQSVIVGARTGMTVSGDPEFANGLQSWTSDEQNTNPLTTPWSVTSGPVSGAPLGGNVLTITDNDDTSESAFSLKVPIDPNKTYRATAYVRQPTGDRTNYLLIALFDDTGANISGSGRPGWTSTGSFHYWRVANSVFPNTWTRYTFTFGANGRGEVPATARYASIGGLFCRSGAVGTNTTVEIQDLKIEEVLPGTLIENDAITAAKIAANTITASELAANSVTASKINVSNLEAVSANVGNLVVESGGHIRSGQTAFDTGTGFYLGSNSGTPKFSIGNSAGNKMTWDGTSLAVKGDIQFSETPGSFTPTNWYSFSSDPTGDIHYIDFGTHVFMWCEESCIGTSNGNNFGFTGGVPAALRPSATVYFPVILSTGTSTYAGRGTLTSGGAMSFGIPVALSGAFFRVVTLNNQWPTASTKGLNVGASWVYPKM